MAKSKKKTLAQNGSELNKEYTDQNQLFLQVRTIKKAFMLIFV